VSGSDIEIIRAKAKGANVNEQTLLATDYLNHFNEAMMLIELVPDMPDCVADLAEWRPISYEEHFRRSNFSGRDIAIECYRLSPAQYRKPFDAVIARLGTLIQATIKGASAMIACENTAAAEEIVHLAMPSIRRYQETAGAIINGADVVVDHDEIIEEVTAEETTLDQSGIDSLMKS
jgi:hypothetical protein